MLISNTAIRVCQAIIYTVFFHTLGCNSSIVWKFILIQYKEVFLHHLAINFKHQSCPFILLVTISWWKTELSTGNQNKSSSISFLPYLLAFCIFHWAVGILIFFWLYCIKISPFCFSLHHLLMLILSIDTSPIIPKGLFALYLCIVSFYFIYELLFIFIFLLSFFSSDIDISISLFYFIFILFYYFIFLFYFCCLPFIFFTEKNMLLIFCFR